MSALDSFFFFKFSDVVFLLFGTDLSELPPHCPH